MSAAQKTILLVEDDILIAFRETRELDEAGYTVLHAVSGEEAIATVTAAPQTIDLILMDINLGPGLDGTQAAQIILQNYDIPIVFLSAHTEPEVVAKTEQITAYGYVVKSGDSTVLAAAIRMAFRLHAAHQTIQRTNERLRLAQIASYAGAWDWDIVHNTFNWSPEFLKIFGLPADTTPGFEAWTAAVFPPDREIAAQRIQEAIDRQIDLVNDYRIVLPGGEIRWIRATGQTYYAGNQPLRMIGLCMDITDHRQTEQALRESEQRFRRVFEDGSLGMVMVGADYRFIRVNRAFCQMIGYTEAELTALTFKDITHPAHLNQDVEQMVRLIKGELPFYQTEKRYCRKNGEVIWGAVTVSIVRAEAGEFLCFLAMIEDITARKQAEEALKASEERFRVAQELALDAFTILRSIRDDTGRITDFEWVYANPAAGRILKQEPGQLIGQRLLEILPGNKENAALFERYVHIVESGQGDKSELRYDADGISGWFRNASVKLGDGVAVSFSDITERKQTEEALWRSEARFRAFMDNSPAIAWAKDEQGRHIYLNRTNENRFNVKLEDWRGKTDFELWPPETAQVFRENDQMVLATGQQIQIEEETINPDGSRSRWLNFKFPFFDVDGRKCVGGIGIDITARKQAEEALQQALAEKEMLMRELQHRVKNSLAVAIGLISLEQAAQPDERVQAIFTNTQARLHTISTLYDQLNQANRPDRIELGDYLHTLVQKLAQVYLAADSQVKIETSLAALDLDPKRAITLGLIVNELVTNALKYAFPAGRRGVIRVELADLTGQVSLGVADNGVGLAPGPAQPERTGMGLKLVEMLTKQLAGQLTVTGQPGVTVRVTFDK